MQRSNFSSRLLLIGLCSALASACDAQDSYDGDIDDQALEDADGEAELAEEDIFGEDFDVADAQAQEDAEAAGDAAIDELQAAEDALRASLPWCASLTVKKGWAGGNALLINKCSYTFRANIVISKGPDTGCRSLAPGKDSSIVWVWPSSYAYTYRC